MSGSRCLICTTFRLTVKMVNIGRLRRIGVFHTLLCMLSNEGQELFGFRDRLEYWNRYYYLGNLSSILG